MVWTPTAKHLPVLRECPVGMVLRESPHVYEAIDLYGFVELGAVDPFRASPWLRSALRVMAAEKQRHWRIDEANRRAKADADYATRMVSRG